MDALDRLRAAVHRDPRAVEQATGELVAAARLTGDQRQLSRSLATRGRARRSLGDIDLAEVDLRAAVAAANRVADAGLAAELAADAHVGLAGVLSFAGRSEEAFGHLDTADRIGSETVRAYCSLQRAIIAQRVGHMATALTAYARALPVLRRLDARTDIALVLMNRGSLRIQTGECAAAVDDMTEAGRLFAAEGNDFGVAQTRHGLGWAYARSGDLPRALQHLDEAAGQFGALGHEALEVEQDRVEVLLAAGLCGEAAQLGRSTAGRLDALGNHSLAAEVWLLCARAALLDGDAAACAAHSERARERFAEQGALGWERAARLEGLRSGLVSGDLAELRALADVQDATGNARGAATALALAATKAAHAGDLDQAGELSADCWRRARRLGILEVRVVAAQAAAACAIAGGDPARARRYVRTGLADLHRHRTALGASDARAAVALHAQQLAGLGLRLAVSSGRAATVLVEMERARAGRGRHPAARPPGDAGQDADLVALRTVVAAVREAEAAGSDVRDLLHRQGELEQAVHRRWLKTVPTGQERRPDLPSVAALRAALEGGCLVELAEVDDRLVGVSVGRRSRLVDVGPVARVRSVAATVAAALRAALFPAPGRRPGPSRPDRSGTAAVDLLTRALQALDPVLAPLLSGAGPVVLVVPAALHAVPWQQLPSLAGRPVVVAPSARWWLEAQAPPQRPAPGGPVLLVAGPRLAEAGREVEAVARHHPRATVLTGAAATTSAVLPAMEQAPLVHLACHGRIRHDNPLWSCLELADGPLYVYDLERAWQTPPVVVLSGCETGVGVRAGDELLGLATALLDHGTRQLVASVCMLPDSAVTVDALAALHGELARGVSPPAALAGIAADRSDPRVALLAGCLAGFGSH